ncbi:hypothetical protein ACF0H5_020256 [Mactra antiquata]
MRLLRETLQDVQEGTAEYKLAVKSVIRYQIQSLLQKLASETGEESIVISTNLTAGTYNHLGSYMGQEYLEDCDDFVQTICSRFTDFCANMQSHSSIVHRQENNVVRTEIPFDTPRNMIPSTRKNLRKRPFVFHNNTSPPNKRPATFHYPQESSMTHPHSEALTDEDNLFMDKGNNSSLFKGDSSSLFKGDNVSLFKGDNASLFKGDNDSFTQSKKDNPCQTLNVPQIKTEPLDDFPPMNQNGNSHQISPEEKSPTCISNRPRSLIPLANIFKKYGTKTVKPEPAVTPESLSGMEDKDEENLSERSILRSLYEQPLFPGEEYSNAGTMEGEKSSQTSLNLPQNLCDSLENYPSTTENLVLSGYYDSEHYPSYRHSRKHPSSSNSKKSKSKEKANTSNTNSPVPGSGSVGQMENVPAVPSSGDLKMKMFESGGRLVYACDVCKRELSHLTSYRRHMKLHTMDRPHKCPVCSKGFIRKYHCIDHLNKHHKGVDFDHDTLTLRGSSKGLDQTSAFSESISISPGEYNYTLDQTIDDTDESMNANCSIDQSASSMLSELAKSAEKARLRDKGDMVEVLTGSQLLDDSKNNSQSNTGGNDLNDAGMMNELNVTNDNTEAADEINEKSEKTSPGKSENSAMARKYEVTQGIKAIVAHLKSSSRRKKTFTNNESHIEKP